MRHVITFLAVAALSVTSACGSDAGGAGDAAGEDVNDAGLDVCGLVSDDTVERLQGASADPQGTPSEVLMRGAEMFVQCRVVSGVELGFAVRAAEGGPGLESLAADDDSEMPAEPLEGVGDEAFIGTNSYDGVRIVARVGPQEVVVNSNAYTGGEIGRDDVIALAKEVAGNLGDELPGAVRLPEDCPSTGAEEVRGAVGETVLARGSATSDGSVTCSYASADRVATLSAATGDEGMRVMALADSEEGSRIEVDGDQGLYDELDGVVVFADDGCVLGASAKPLDWGLADQRSESERRDEAIELVTYVKESIGCP
ncbi:hypothetical protein [Aeromicrobium chenweiae]|uniref:Uncharacterized protein n=1 Tax=Aeromicrobium chenweiae TaxID=2079793 RepID=A0A2S0WMX8_9ACTN|nr:hypothetical protein [Aeromicrobium chenweiae]AWB92703.1 hypothetical protein C3E78_11095 [Aeromicrobium chenweiae]TGN33694.1 hypothetical protein E4L97_01140 [Aeromicrobium chenweiae]